MTRNSSGFISNLWFGLIHSRAKGGLPFYLLFLLQVHVCCDTSKNRYQYSIPPKKRLSDIGDRHKFNIQRSQKVHFFYQIFKFHFFNLKSVSSYFATIMDTPSSAQYTAWRNKEEVTISRTSRYVCRCHTHWTSIFSLFFIGLCFLSNQQNPPILYIHGDWHYHSTYLLVSWDVLNYRETSYQKKYFENLIHRHTRT